MAQAGLKVIRSLFRLSSRVAPDITGRLAFRLFCTPLGKAPPKEGTPATRAARALFSRAEQQFSSYPSGYVRVHRFNPEGAARGTVLVLHGLNGEALSMSGFIEALLEQNFRVIAPDLPAHGGSSGGMLTFPLVMEALEAVLHGEEPLAGIVAHSLGAALAVIATAGTLRAFEPVSSDRLVLVAMPRAVEPYGRAFTRLLGISARAYAAYEAKVRTVTGRPSADFNARDDLARLMVPTLLIHAPDDKEIPFSDAETVASAGCHVALHPLPGYGHRRILFAKEAHHAAAQFLVREPRRATLSAAA